MAHPFYNWSITAANNATADSTVGWAEGQLPSTINDSARSMMASTAAYRDDTAGAIVTGGTSTAYTVTTYEIFDTLAHLANQVVAFTPHTTNGATVTLNVDGLGAKPLRSAPSVELPAGVLVQGTPYVALYNNSDAAFYLQGFYTNPYQIPIGGSLDYWGTSAPNSSFALMYGQAISRTTYASLFSLFSTTYGVGDGSTTFNIPDLRGRVVAGDGDMGGSDAARLTSTYFGAAGTTLGAVGGSESSTLITANLPPYTPAGSVFSTTSQTTSNWNGSAQAGGTQVTGNSAAVAITIASTFTGTAQGGSSTPVRTVQPTIIGNKILRLI